MTLFEWDPEKAEENWREHEIRFSHAIEAFDDPNLISRPDDRYDYGEERWRTIGMTSDLLLVIVAHTFRGEDDSEVIRLISARRAKPHEWRLYDNRKL